MKKISYLFLSMSFFCFLFPLTSYSDKYDDALKEIESEKLVVSASWGVTNSSLFVGVRDNGTARDGYAQYICLLLSDYKINDVIVHIMDGIAIGYGKHKELGKSVCP